MSAADEGELVAALRAALDREKALAVALRGVRAELVEARAEPVEDRPPSITLGAGGFDFADPRIAALAVALEISPWAALGAIFDLIGRAAASSSRSIPAGAVDGLLPVVRDRGSALIRRGAETLERVGLARIAWTAGDEPRRVVEMLIG